jgi:hypothetical protein
MATQTIRPATAGSRRPHGSSLLPLAATLGTLLVCVVVICAASTAIGEDRPNEYQVKAAMIFNFMKFVEWPAEAFSVSDKHITLCTIGTNPFGRALESLAGKEVRGRPVSLSHIETVDDIKSCHVLYVGESEKERIGAIAEKASAHHALTVSDTVGFAQRGLFVNFYFEEGTVRFEINLSAAHRAGLTVSSKLLKLARIVEDAPAEKEK